MTRRAAPRLVFALLFSAYLRTCYPTIAPRDSADLAVAAMTAGVAHPPGYPLYSLLGNFWLSVFRLGNPAYRLNVLSAAFGAGAAALLCAALASEAGVGAAAGAALSWGFGAALWKFSLLEEMYSLAAFFAAALLALSRGEPNERRLRASALVYGLALVNHQSAVLWAPALAILWAPFLRRSPRALVPALAFFAAGLSLYGFVWLRLGDAAWAWRVLSRAEYGSLTLSSRFAHPFSAWNSVALLGHFFTGWIGGASWLVAATAAAGAYRLWESERRLVGALTALAACCGPAYFLLTRFDVSSWVARSVLESAFIIPAFAACAAAAYGLSLLPWKSARLAAASATVLSVAWGAGAVCDHRDDFSAYDYVRDLRRFVPPGAAAIMAGDTALFGSRYLDLARPEEPARRRLSSVEDGKRAWMEKELHERPVYVVGLPPEMMGELGLGSSHRATSAGLALQIDGGSGPGESAWLLSVYRTPRAAEAGESYARDLNVSYAYAHFLAGNLAETLGEPESFVAAHHREAMWLDPQDYQVVSVKDRQ